jgi:tetratricopeptide (TPR) repeat protein
MGRSAFFRSWSIVTGLLVGIAAACAAEIGDCGHPVASRSIPACSRLIERGGVTPDMLADYHLFRGTAHLLMAEPDKAIADLDQAVRLKPASPEALVARGDAHRSKGDFKRAIADYDEAIRIDPKYIAGHIAKVQAFYAKGERVRARELEKDVALLGWSLDGIMNATQRRAVQADRQQLDRTFARLDAAIDARPKDAAPYVSRADHLMRLSERQFARAAADLAEAIRLDPTHVDAYFRRAQLYVWMKEPGRALEDLGQVLVHAANDPYKMADAFQSRSRIFRDRGDFDRHTAEFDQAILNYEKALVPLKQKQWNIEPMLLGLYDERCESLAGRRSWDKALAACGQAIGRSKLAGKSASHAALLVRGDIHFRLGNSALAIADYDEIIRLFSNNHPVAAKGYHRRGLAHERTGAREQAIADLRQARAAYMRSTNRDAELAAVAEALRRLGVPD